MNVFVYGTLLVPRIWELVTERPDLSSIEASLSGHSIWRVKNATFPAIREEKENTGSVVPGRVFFYVPELALKRLDLYEDSFYDRVAVTVDTESGPVEAQVYRVPCALAEDIVASETWTLSWFEENGLAEFLENVFDH